MIFLFYAIQMQELFEINWPEVDKEHLPQTHALFSSIKSRQRGERYWEELPKLLLNFMGFIPFSPLHEHICLPGDGRKRKISFKTP